VDGRADVVYGSRFAGGSEQRVVWFWHKAGNKILTFVSNMFSNLALTDMETCYKVFTRDVLNKIIIEEDRFGIEPEFTAKIATLVRNDNISVYEIPISYRGRSYDEGKKIGIKDAFRAFFCILKYNTTGFAKFVKYALCCLLVALSQIVTIIFLIDFLGFSNVIMQNIAHAISIEISIITGYYLHSRFTWNWKFTKFSNVILKFIKFNFITGVSFIIRIILFYLIMKTGIGYKVNTLIGIGVAVIFNFAGYDRFIYRNNIRKVQRYE
jgi:putative flippase GtrA